MSKLSIEEVFPPEVIEMLYNPNTQERLIHRELFDFEHEPEQPDFFVDRDHEEFAVDESDWAGMQVIISAEEASEIFGGLKLA